VIARRSLLRAAAATAVAAGAVAAGLELSGEPGRTPSLAGQGPADTAAADELTSAFFATAFTEYFGSLATASDGDLWPVCWADDDSLYTANGDGTGFGTGAPEADIVVSRVTGTPETGLAGTSYTMTFDPARGDGVRIIGVPGGRSTFTSIAELAIYYDG
jgi:hypothetical protein